MMRTILYILQKEFTQIFRNRTMLPFIFLMPILQMILLAYAATLDMKDIDLVVVDQDLSSSSREMASKFEGSPFFVLKGKSFSLEQAQDMVSGNKADMILHIPAGFERTLAREQKADVQVLINGINNTAASLTQAYASSVIADYNRKIIPQWLPAAAGMQTQQINVDYRYWFNSELNFKFFMVPGILVILVTIIGAFLAALNLVREKEMGTMEQINVTPIQKYQFLIGKLLPFWFIALFELGFGLTIAKILFDIPIVGGLPLLFGFAAVYLIVALGIGLFISTLANTQQQVMFIIFFFMLTFIIMSGVFTPTESMPEIAQKINIINPFAYFMRSIRMILLKGSGFADIWPEMRSLGIYAIIIMGLSVWRYRKVA